MKPLLLALGALISFSAQAQQFSFKDWVVACDNTRHCEAVGYQAEDAEAAVSLWLARDAGGSAQLHGRLAAMTEQGEAGIVSIRVGDVLVKGIQPETELTPAQLAQLLPALKKADVAVVSDGHGKWALSLSGLNAALLKIDDLQGRVGTVTALARPGAKPASVVPAASPAPLLRAVAVPAPRASDTQLLPAILKTLRDADCEAEAPPAEYGRNSEISRLSATEVLVFQECLRGAYQSAYGIWRVSDKPPYKAVRILLPNAEGKLDDMLTEPYFDKGVLGSFAKGRGLADCGTSDQWLWTAEGFRLKESSIGPMCRGMPGGGFMLRLWTTR